jgi:hypothetical protein
MLLDWHVICFRSTTVDLRLRRISWTSEISKAVNRSTLPLLKRIHNWIPEAFSQCLDLLVSRHWPSEHNVVKPHRSVFLRPGEKSFSHWSSIGSATFECADANSCRRHGCWKRSDIVESTTMAGNRLKILLFPENRLWGVLCPRVEMSSTSPLFENIDVWSESASSTFDPMT